MGRGRVAASSIVGREYKRTSNSRPKGLRDIAFLNIFIQERYKCVLRWTIEFQTKSPILLLVEPIIHWSFQFGSDPFHNSHGYQSTGTRLLNTFTKVSRHLAIPLCQMFQLVGGKSDFFQGSVPYVMTFQYHKEKYGHILKIEIQSLLFVRLFGYIELKCTFDFCVCMVCCSFVSLF